MGACWDILDYGLFRYLVNFRVVPIILSLVKFFEIRSNSGQFRLYGQLLAGPNVDHISGTECMSAFPCRIWKPPLAAVLIGSDLKGEAVMLGMKWMMVPPSLIPSPSFLPSFFPVILIAAAHLPRGNWFMSAVPSTEQRRQSDQITPEEEMRAGSQSLMSGCTGCCFVGCCCC